MQKPSMERYIIRILQELLYQENFNDMLDT